MDLHTRTQRRIALLAYWLPLIVSLLAVIFIVAPEGFA